MKKKLLLTLVMGCLLLAGCKNNKEPVESTTALETSTTAIETDTESKVETTKAENVTNSQPQHTVDGIVDDAAMSSIAIELEDGSILNLQREGCEIISKEGIAIGDKVELTYEGDQVVKIVVK